MDGYVSYTQDGHDEPGVGSDQSEIAVEPGGTPAPFVSNYPVQSWAPDALTSDLTPQYGSPQTLSGPAAADGCRIYLATGFEWGWTQQDAGCQPWTVILAAPDVVPATYLPTSDGRVIAWAGVSSWPLETDPERLYLGSRSGETYRPGLPVMTGSGGSFSSNLPAVFAPGERFAEYYVDDPAPTSWSPIVVGGAAGACRDEVSGVELPVTGGACGPFAIEPWPFQTGGTDQHRLLLLDAGGGPVAQTTHHQGFLAHMAQLAIHADAISQLGTDLEIDAATGSGTAAEWTIDVSSSAAAGSAGLHAAAGVPVASFHGSLDVTHGGSGAAVNAAVPGLPEGSYEVAASMTDVKGEVVTATKVVQVTDTQGPAGTVLINGGAPFVKGTAVSVGVPASDVSGVATVALSNDGTHWVSFAYKPAIAWTLPATDGVRTVWAKWRDGKGFWSAPKKDTIVLDRLNPSIGSTSRTMRVDASLVGGTLVRVSWSGSDAGSGIHHYELQRSINGGAWKLVSSTVTTPYADVRLATGRTYRFRILPVDRVGRRGAWVSTPSFAVTRKEDASTSVVFSGTWRRVTNGTYSGGTAKIAAGTTARATLTATGRAIGFMSRKGPTFGVAAVYVDGAKVATIDLHADAATSQLVVWSKTWPVAGKHTVSIRVSGTAGHPDVLVDAFLVLS